MEFHDKKSRFKESECADAGRSLNRDFTVLSRNIIISRFIIARFPCIYRKLSKSQLLANDYLIVTVQTLYFVITADSAKKDHLGPAKIGSLLLIYSLSELIYSKVSI